ncbi:hypothetical protein [Roseimicrobium sp. ORNL1]|uniref:hypothetical protein n=1 Tax=Roseimicrobium sp. ORNL1 TaxID=2711231 RepID=UPI0013E2040A|nr:hypothetical protein [Roseimicrobium sp. ORNL1]QIF01424.1 hypothetical protein G5S37_07785 [Roseimicrobium sp. ORNL1]
MPLLAAALTCVAATGLGQTPDAITTKLTGFHTVTARKSSTTLLGIHFVRSRLASGKVDAKAANSLTDNDVDFATALAGQTNLWVEITSGPNKGIASPVSSVSQNVLTTEDDISALMEVDDTYAVRPAHTPVSLFGAANDAGLRPSNNANTQGNADIVQIPNGSGGYRYIYYSTVRGGWREVGSPTVDAGNVPVYHVDGIWIDRNRTTNLNIKFAGELRTSPTYFFAETGTKIDVNASYNTGATLTNSGLKDYVQHGSETTADLIWFQNTNGTWSQYYYTDAAAPLTEGWKQVGQGDADKGATAFPSAFSFERRGVSGILKMVPPPAYDGL